MSVERLEATNEFSCESSPSLFWLLTRSIRLLCQSQARLVAKRVTFSLSLKLSISTSEISKGNSSEVFFLNSFKLSLGVL